MQNNILLMPFLDESSNYTYGFEAGQLWQKMTNGEVFDKYLIHTDNKAQVQLMVEHFGYENKIETVDDTWSYLTGKPIDISAAF